MPNPDYFLTEATVPYYHFMCYFLNEATMPVTLCPASLPFSRMGSGFPLLSRVYTLAEDDSRQKRTAVH